MRKRVLSLILAAALLAACVPAAQAQAGRTMRFADVPEGAWYYSAVKELYEAGVIDGRSKTRFGSGEDVTWGEAFKLILLSIGCEEPERVKGEHWAYCYIRPALDNRLVYSFNAEYLDAAPTRQEVARMVARGLDLLSISGESPFVDCDDGYVVELYEKGIFRGAVDGEGRRWFHPDEPISREELAAVLCRMRKTDVTEGMFRYSNYWIDPLEEVPALEYDTALFTPQGSAMAYAGGQTTLGIDVSGHKGDIDWERVRADGIEFAIIRVGGRFIQSGQLYDDSYFTKNIEGALAAGLKVGVYFFSQAITAEEGLEEARYVLERIRGYDITYPVVCDWEYLMGGHARTDYVQPREVTAGIKAFCEEVAQAGYRPMVYFNAYCAYIKMDLRELTDYDFWYAEYEDRPDFLYHFQMWQYSAEGRVDGISGKVDMDLCFVPYGEPGP